MSQLSSVEKASEIVCDVTAGICLVTVTLLIIFVNKRMPGSFAVNIFLYTCAIISRAISLYLSFLAPEVRIAIITICMSLIELSLAYFIF
jgi:hypothetical protein